MGLRHSDGTAPRSNGREMSATLTLKPFLFASSTMPVSLSACAFGIFASNGRNVFCVIR